MHYRKLGNTGLTVSEVGLGCNRLGEKSEGMDHWAGIVREALDLGVSIFDTSETYNDGRSEEIIGRVIKESDRALIATKASASQAGTNQPYSRQHIITSCEKSLKRLNTDCIDIYQLHSPTREELAERDWADGLRLLQEQGKIRIPAVAIRTADDGLFVIRQGFAKVLQVTYNIFERGAEKELFAKATESGVGLLNRMPLARGILTGKFTPGQPVEDGHRATNYGAKMASMIEQAAQLSDIADGYDGGMTRLAHHFCLSRQAISAIIPGASTREQVLINVAASNGDGLSADLRGRVDEVRAGWDTI